jgi:hypothetical protein
MIVAFTVSHVTVVVSAIINEHVMNISRHLTHVVTRFCFISLYTAVKFSVGVNKVREQSLAKGMV